MTPSTDAMDFLEAWCARSVLDHMTRGRVSIELVDGPAWSVTIDLLGTDLEGCRLEPRGCDLGNGRWWHRWTEDGTFRAVAALGGLRDAVEAFHTAATGAADPIRSDD